MRAATMASGLLLLNFGVLGCQKESAAPPARSTPPTVAEPAPAPVDAANPRFRCVGNEPGWTLAIGPDSLVFVGDYGEVRAAYPGVVPRTGDGIWYYESNSRSGPSGYSRLVAVVVRDSCSDGMSDRIYPYRARVLHDLKGYVGCADRP
jgi:uncharacterized membrane protein